MQFILNSYSLVVSVRNELSAHETKCSKLIFYFHKRNACKNL